MNEFSPQQRAAMATAALLIDGPQRADNMAHTLYDSEQDGWYLFNNLSTPLRLINTGGWWYVSVSPFADVRALLELVGARVDETPPSHAFCRPLTRAEMVRIEKLLRHILKIGQPPPP